MAMREKGLRGLFQRLGLDKLFGKAEEVDVHRTHITMGKKYEKVSFP